VSAINIGTCQEEINHLQTWAVENNLKLNRDKTKEIDFTASRKRAPPPPRPDIERVSSLRIFGVIINDRLSAADHVIMLLSSCSSLLSLTATRCRILDPGNDDSVEPVRNYAMRVLREHGTPATSQHDIFNAIVVSRIQYAAPAWS